MADQPRTLSYVGGPWAGATVTVPAALVVDHRDADDGTYTLDGDTYTWRPDQSPAEPEAEAVAEERPAEPADNEETRPAPEQPLHERPAPARRSRRPSASS